MTGQDFLPSSAIPLALSSLLLTWRTSCRARWPRPLTRQSIRCAICIGKSPYEVFEKSAFCGYLEISHAGLTKAIICLTTAPQLQKHSEHQRYLTLDTCHPSFTPQFHSRAGLSHALDHWVWSPARAPLSSRGVSRAHRPTQSVSSSLPTSLHHRHCDSDSSPPSLLIDELLTRSFHIPFSAAAAAL